MEIIGSSDGSGAAFPLYILPKVFSFSIAYYCYF